MSSEIRVWPGLAVRDRRAAGKFPERGIADILQIGDADFAGVEAVAGHFAQERKESDALAECGIFFGVLAIGDQVQHLVALLPTAFHLLYRLANRRETIQPYQSAAQPQLVS